MSERWTNKENIHMAYKKFPDGGYNNIPKLLHTRCYRLISFRNRCQVGNFLTGLIKRLGGISFLCFRP
jgi:hypothetical protein